MASFYTLILGFKTSDPIAVSNGAFMHDDPSQTNPLMRSRIWLSSNGVPNYNSTFTVVGADNQMSMNVNDQAFVLIWTPDANASSLTARTTVIFGRAAGTSGQSYRTPFLLGPGVACNVFDSIADRNGNFPGPNFGNSAWLSPLGAIQRGPNVSAVMDKYFFMVGLTIWSGGRAFTFGHDPEVDIGMGAPVAATAP